MAQRSTRTAPAVRPPEPLRLLYLINGLGTGGAERSLAELLPFYLANRIEPTIVCLYRRKEGVEDSLRSLGYEIRYLPAGRLPGKILALRRSLRAERPDLIHTTLFESNLIGRLAAAGTGIPLLTSLVNTPYDPIRLQDPNINRLGISIVKSVDRWTGHFLTTHFHALTHAVKEAAVQTLHIPPERITVIGRGRAPERLGTPSAERRAQARRHLGLRAEDEVILTVGRQEYQKGQRFLLEAMRLLVPTRPHLQLLISGRTGHATSELQELHESSGLGERVRFLGHREDVPDLLAAADIFAFPSLFEGFGGALIEAMALGLPIVASDLPTLREVVEPDGSGVLVEPASPPALAAAITRLLDDPELARALGSRGMEIFHERFTVERSAMQMIELYRLAGQRFGTRREDGSPRPAMAEAERA
ncbi:glycosyltransferase family 4 protein [soil metagenome]